MATPPTCPVCACDSSAKNARSMRVSDLSIPASLHHSQARGCLAMSFVDVIARDRRRRRTRFFCCLSSPLGRERMRAAHLKRIEGNLFSNQATKVVGSDRSDFMPGFVFERGTRLLP